MLETAETEERSSSKFKSTNLLLSGKGNNKKLYIGTKKTLSSRLTFLQWEWLESTAG